MPKKLVRRGRVRGYRPTHSQLEEILELAQKDLDDTSIAHLVHSKGELEVYPQGEAHKIIPNQIDEIIKEVSDPDELHNLFFSISQATPMRNVEIRIGPGSWTTYRVESDDQTWAYGRFHELTDTLMSDRSLYAKFRSRSLKVPKEGTDDRWRAAVWEPARDWRIFAIGFATTVPWWPLVLTALFAILLGQVAASPGSNPTDKQGHQVALQDVHYLGAHAAILTISILSYIIFLFAYQRWLRTWLRCKVILRKRSVASQFSFRGGNSDSVALASFYVALFAFIVTIITLVIQ